jgi:methylmalonyl-CoA mutase N-terminal domain/subunit
MLRFHSQTAGSTLTAQQPYNNVMRVTLQALAAVLGGTQSLHTNSLDEALALPSEFAAGIALRTQQLIASESNVTQAVDPLAGSWFVESLTAELEKRAWDYLGEIERRGGAIACIESGYIQTEISNSAYLDQKAVDDGRLKVVGVNCYQDQAEASSKVDLLKIAPELERAAVERIRAWRAKRSAKSTESALRALSDGAKGTVNVQGLILDAVKAGATLGEVSDTMRGVFGVYRGFSGF